MILSRTPFRISFAGGGTDLDAFYRSGAGAVVTTAIDKYMYVTVNRYFDDRIILKYSQVELVDRVEDIRHPILRECLRKVGIRKGIEITSMADVPGGTGLGSSSSFTVGVLNALHAFQGEMLGPGELAREACEIEIERLQEPVGKQDQFIAAYGGLRYLRFLADESVLVEPLACPPGTLERLQARLVLLFTGITRQAGPLLHRARTAFTANRSILERLHEQAEDLRVALQSGDVLSVGDRLHEGWELKKQLAEGISTPGIDDVYAAARAAGAQGGKILGAGGGGFLLLFVPPERRETVLASVKGWREIPFRFEPEGSRIIHVSG